MNYLLLIFTISLQYVCSIHTTQTFPLSLDPNLAPSPTEEYPYKEIMDPNGNYHLYWNRNDTHVTLEIHVRTHGYVGFGLSNNGKMFPADIVIGWVKDGKTFFKDRHSVAHAVPKIDQSQDWILLHGFENSFGTVLKFTRKIITCDPDDMEITEATMRAIYSYHPDDPQDENSIPYHGFTTRGARSIMLLSKSEEVKLPDDAFSVDFLNDKFVVPAADTTYQCTVFDLKWLGQKHHLRRV
uniref:DOMON domain-containing protein n=1 Tax=Pinctada fucata TaxID=50426 RepID=A0A194ALW7_PINFU